MAARRAVNRRPRRRRRRRVGLSVRIVFLLLLLQASLAVADAARPAFQRGGHSSGSPRYSNIDWHVPAETAG
eukprot:6834284-Prymnesium_polylepis.1